MAPPPFTAHTPPRHLLEGGQLLDALGDPLFVHDSEFAIVYANAAYLKRAGRPLQEVIGQPYWKIYPRHDGPLPRERFDLATGQTQEFHLPLEGGRLLRSRAYPVHDAAGNVPYVLQVMEEIAASEDREPPQQQAVLQRQVERLNAQLRELATTDPLTGITNRQEFENAARREISRLHRYGGRLSLILFDVDHLRGINAEFGHTAGDRVLRTVATLVRNNIRGTDEVGRWGGGTMVILAPNMELGEATGFAVKLRRILGEFGAGDVGRLSASFGVAEYRPGESAELLLSRAEAALFIAKARGRDRVETERALETADAASPP